MHKTFSGDSGGSVSRLAFLLPVAFVAPAPPEDPTLGPPVERCSNKGTVSFFSVVYFSRGTLPTKQGVEKGTQLGDLLWMDEILHRLKPWNDDSTANTNQQWLQSCFHFVVPNRILSTHSSTPVGVIFGENPLDPTLRAPAVALPRHCGH